MDVRLDVLRKLKVFPGQLLLFSCHYEDGDWFCRGFFSFLYLSVSDFLLLLQLIFISFMSRVFLILLIDCFLWFLDHQCLRPPYGVVFLATKRTYVGFNNATRHLRSLMDEEGIFGAHLVKEVTDRDIWKFFIKWIKRKKVIRLLQKPENGPIFRFCCSMLVTLFLQHVYSFFFFFSPFSVRKTWLRIKRRC